MKISKIGFSILILIFITAPAGYFYYTDSDFKSSVHKLINSKSSDNPKHEAVHNSVFAIFDPSGSGRNTYSVPRIDTAYVKKLIKRIRDNGSGDLWVSYIDKDALNNNVLHISVARAPVKPQKPERTAGEPRIKFNERTAEYEKAIDGYQRQIEHSNQAFEGKVNQFAKEVQRMIKKAYAPKKSGDDYSDVIGSINTGNRALSSIDTADTNFRTLLLISDGVQDLKPGSKPTELKAIPSDIQMITVNHSGSDKNVVARRTINLATLDQALSKSIQTFKAQSL
jgi:hypothetical protein